MTAGPVNSEAAFVPTSKVFDTDDPTALRYSLTESYIVLSQGLNQREIAIYTTEEILDGQQFIDSTNPQNFKPVYRQTYYFGAIAQGATLTIAHNITNLVQFTNIYGTCITDVVDYRPLPSVGVVAATDGCSLKCDATNIIIKNGATAANITSGIVVLEYLKS